MNESFDGLVLLFHTAADPSRAARLHSKDCAMVNTSRGRRGIVKRIETDLTDVVADLNDSGYPVKRCKCC